MVSLLLVERWREWLRLSRDAAWRPLGLSRHGLPFVRQLRDKARNGRRNQDACRVGSTVDVGALSARREAQIVIRIKDKYG